MQFNTVLTQDELDRMIDAIAPSWRIREATPTDAGHHAVYQLAVETTEGNRGCYLKATPENKDPSVDLEARLLMMLDRHTGIRVPTVHGIVDEHDQLPAPFVLMEAVPGELNSRTELASVPNDRLRGFARDTGRQLADLHSLDAVDGFGFLTAAGPTLYGARPSGDLDTVAVADPVADWRERLHDWANGTLNDLEDTRFADVVPEARPIVDSRIDDINGPFEPALARIDSSFENVLLADDGLSAMLDWEFTIAATPAYDVTAVAWSLAGGPYLFAPEVPDRRDLIGEAILDGYRERGNGRVTEQVRTNRECYELLAALRSMVHLRSWYRLFDLGEQIDDAASNLRDEVSVRL